VLISKDNPWNQKKIINYDMKILGNKWVSNQLVTVILGQRWRFSTKLYNWNGLQMYTCSIDVCVWNGTNYFAVSKVQSRFILLKHSLILI